MLTLLALPLLIDAINIEINLNLISDCNWVTGDNVQLQSWRDLIVHGGTLSKKKPSQTHLGVWFPIATLLTLVEVTDSSVGFTATLPPPVKWAMRLVVDAMQRTASRIVRS